MQTSKTTFFLEDNPGDLELLKQKLQSAGWPLTNTGHEVRLTDAIRTILAIKPEVVFLDLNVPDSNGLATFKQVQDAAPDIPIIIVSSVKDMSISMEAVQYGAQDFLIKGEIDERILLKTVLYSIERKKNLVKLEEANQRYEYAGKATNEPLWDLDIRTNEIVWNDKVNIFGYLDSLEKNDSWRLANIHPKDKSKVLRLMAEVNLNKTDVWSMEFRFRCASGKYKHILDRAFVLRDKANKPYRIIGTMQDLTEKRKLEQKIRQQKSERQRAILRATLEAQEREKNWLSLELHDNINQILTSARIYLSAAKNCDETKRLEILNKSHDLISTAVVEIRNLSHAMSNNHLNDLGLIPSIIELIDKTMQANNVTISFTHNLENIQLEKAFYIPVFRVIQEQLSNILKHADASSITINLLKKERSLDLTISDNGKGTVLSQKNKGIGLYNIETRIKSLNGVVRLQSTPGNGFVLEATLPFVNVA